MLVTPLAACGPETITVKDERPVVAAAWPDDLFVDAAPEGALRITEVKPTAAVGDVVTVRGRVGGALHPFVEGRAVMTIADPEAIDACDARENDPCETPWDYCCEPLEEIVAATATVQVAGADGRPLHAALNGAGGLAPHTPVVVRGKVAQTGDGGVLVIDAESIHVAR